MNTYIVFIFVLHKIYSLTAPTTVSLQKSGMDIIPAIESVRKSRKRLEIAQTFLSTNIRRAEEFIQQTNNLLLNDSDILALKSDCYIHLPTIDEKHKMYTEIVNSFEHFIRISIGEIDERILREIDDTDDVHKEISLLDPRNAEKTFANDRDKFSLKNLCRINRPVPTDGRNTHTDTFQVHALRIRDLMRTPM